LGHFKTAGALENYRPLSGIGYFIQKLGSLKKAPLHWLHKFDYNRDGKLCYDDWRNAYAQTAGEFLKTGTDSTAAPAPLAGLMKVPDPSCHGIMAQNENHQLVIADCHQNELLERIGTKNLLLLIGGALLIAVGVVVSVYFFTR
jgi:hypothetical protein